MVLWPLKKPSQILFISIPDPTHPEGEVHSAESSTILAPLTWSLGNTHCQLGSPNVYVHRPFALYWQMSVVSMKQAYLVHYYIVGYIKKKKNI